MRKLFVTLAKIFGVYELYRALLIFVRAVFDFADLIGRESAFSPKLFWDSLSSAAAVGISIALAWLLLAKTNWLADKLGISDDTFPYALSGKAIQIVGIQLISLYLIAVGIPSFVFSIVEYKNPAYISLYGPRWTMFIAPMIQFGFGAIFATRARRIADYLDPPDDSIEIEPGPDAEA